MTHDPIKSPQRGDVLRHGKLTVTVLSVDRRVHYEVLKEGGKGLDAFPVQRIKPLAEWEKEVMGYEAL